MSRRLRGIRTPAVALTALWTVGSAGCDESQSKEFYPLPAIGKAARQTEGGREKVPEEPERTPEEQADEARSELRRAGGDAKAIHQRMQENFIRADELQKAVIAGDLDEAREKARWIATHSAVQGLPNGWLAHITAMRRAARSVVDARDLEAAARGTAFVAGACGSCHLVQLGGADLGAEPLPQRAASATELKMKRHQWAADRMWDAVVSGRSAMWEDAVETLESTRLRPSDLDERGPPERLAELVGRLDGVVERAKRANAPDARVRVLGAFLATCSSCHQMVEGGPEAW